MASNQYIVEARDLRRSLPLGPETLHVLRGLTFNVREKEWVALTGPSGSGKSTLLGLLAGIDRPTSGALRVAGESLDTLPERELARIRNEKIGIVFQTFNLIPSMSAQQNVELPLYIGPRRKEARERAREMLEEVGLGDRVKHLPHQLSGGQQQRVAIARALVTQPRLLLADEPTGNLDSGASEQVLTLIARLRDAFGLTVVMVTHDPQVAGWADRVLHLVDGELVAPVASPAPARAREVAV